MANDPLANKTLFNSLKEHMDQILDGKITDGSIIKNCFQAIEKVIWEDYSPEIATSQLIDSWDRARQADTFLSFFPSLADPLTKAQVRMKAVGILGDSSLELKERKAQLLSLVKDYVKESIDDFSDLDTVFKGRLVALKDEWRSVLRGNDKNRKIDKNKILQELESKPLERLPEQERNEVQTLKYLAALNFSTIPLDAKREIFKFLPSSDLKNLARVDKACKSLSDQVWFSNHRIFIKQCIEKLITSLGNLDHDEANLELMEINLSLDLPKSEGEDPRAHVLEKAHAIAFALAGTEDLELQKIHKIYRDELLSCINPFFQTPLKYFYELIAAFQEIRQLVPGYALSFALDSMSSNDIQEAKTSIEQVGLKNILLAIKHRDIVGIRPFLYNLFRCIEISSDTLKICANSSQAILETAIENCILHSPPNYADIVLSNLPNLQNEESQVLMKTALIATLLTGKTKSPTASSELKIIHEILDLKIRHARILLYVESMINSNSQSVLKNAFTIQDLSVRQLAFQMIAENTEKLDPLLDALKQIQNPEIQQNIAKQKFVSFMKKNQIDMAQELLHAIASSDTQKELLKLYPQLK